MRKSIVPLVVAALLVSFLFAPGQIASAQDILVPAEVNKSFAPISIPSGGTSRLSVTIFNPNGDPLTNASWTDNLTAVQPGLRIASPPNVSNSCGGTVNATAGSTSFSLSGGTVPAQSGSTPGRCTVTISVTSTTVGNLINRIPSGALSSTINGEPITNTDPASATLAVTGTPTPPPTPPPPTLPPVELDKSFSPGTIWAGGISRLSIRITNNQTNQSLTQTSLTDNLPANVFLASPPSPSLSGCGASASVSAASGGTSVTLNNGTVAPSSVCTIQVDVTSNVQGSYTNRIPAGSLQNQQNLSNPSDVTDRLRVDAIGITKAFDPGAILAGETTLLTITLQNPTGSAYTGASFTDNLPSPMIVASSPSASNGCGGTLSAAPNSGSISLSGGVIPPGSPTAPGTCTITVPVTVPAGSTSGNLTNSIPQGGLTTNQGVSNPRAASDRITVRGTNVTASKSFADNTLTPGESTRLRIDYRAPSDTNLTGFSIRDELPAGITISGSTQPTTSGCGASATLTAVPGTNLILLQNGTILAGQLCRIQVWVTGNAAGSYTNTIPLSNITNNENRFPPADLNANLTINNPAPSGLSITLVKGFDPLIVTGGAVSTMSIQLINPESVALTGITFTDNMPAGMVLADPANFDVGSCGGTLSGTPGGNNLTFSGGSLPAQSDCTLTLSATMSVNGNLTNTIPAGAVSTNNGATNADPAEASLTNLPGASVTKSFAPNPIPAGSYSLLTIIIRNTGNIELVDMGMSDSLPSGLEIAGASAPAPTNDCGGSLTAVPGTQLIELAGGTLAGNSFCTIVVGITGNNPGDYQNTIPVGGMTADPNTRNSEPATATLTITDGNTNPPPVAGGGGGGRPRNNTDDTEAVATANTFLIPVTAGFAPGQVTRLDASSRLAYDATGLSLEIPVLRLKNSIVGVESKNGNWDISWLRDQVGWLSGTAYPTWKGNSVLTAHVTNADGKPGVFSKLKYLGIGEYIFVYNSGYRYTYKVLSNTFVQQDDSRVMQHEEKPYLTLITCDTYDEKTGTYLRYVMVRAALVDVRPVE